MNIDISYTLDGASHAVGRRKLKPDHGVDTEHDNLCILYWEMDKVDNKSSFMQLKSI